VSFADQRFISMKIFYFLIVGFMTTTTAYPQSRTIRIVVDSVQQMKVESTPFQARNQNPFALVAGGSKGIGYAIAEALAMRKYNLILIARHHTPLLNAKEELEAKYNIQVEILSYDLSKETSGPAIAEWCLRNKIPLKMLCNVAGLGGTNDYLNLKCHWIQCVT
jgi:hypothetical protein